MLNIAHVRLYVVRPALVQIGLWSEEAEALVMGTGAQESGYRHLRQLARSDGRRGPARGLWQMEPATHSAHLRWLEARPELKAKVMELTTAYPEADDLMWNLRYAAAMCRIHYRRVKAALPPADPLSLALYWKQYYNTPKGAGTPEEFMRNYNDMLASERRSAA